MFSFYYNSILKDVFGIVVKTYLYEHTFIQMCCQIYLTLISSHLSINREGRWGATDDFATSFLHSSQFSTALWDLENSRPVHSQMCSSVCLVFFPLSLSLGKWLWTDLMIWRHNHTTAVCVSLRWSGLRVVRVPAGSRHGPLVR